MARPPSRTCYVKFDASDREYAYDCGALTPVPPCWVVVPVGADAKKKIVRCVGVVDGIDPIVNKTIFGIIQEQPKQEPTNASSL